jgi:hypothetical protein
LGISCRRFNSILPAIGDDNTIYFGADNGMLYAISPNGKKKWEFVTSGPILLHRQLPQTAQFMWLRLTELFMR